MLEIVVEGEDRISGVVGKKFERHGIDEAEGSRSPLDETIEAALVQALRDPANIEQRGDLLAHGQGGLQPEPSCHEGVGLDQNVRRGRQWIFRGAESIENVTRLGVRSIGGRQQCEDRGRVDEDSQTLLPVVPESFVEIGVMLTGDVVGFLAIGKGADHTSGLTVEIPPRPAASR